MQMGGAGTVAPESRPTYTPPAAPAAPVYPPENRATYTPPATVDWLDRAPKTAPEARSASAYYG